MKYNMNFYDIALRYAIGYMIIMVGVLTQQLLIVFLGVPFLMIGLLGMCPLFYVLGINHNNFEDYHEPIQYQKTSKQSIKNKPFVPKEAA